MNERQRIEALLQQGRITEDEAQVLLEALVELEEEEGAGQVVVTERPIFTTPQRWAKVHLQSHELEVVLDATLDKPHVEGEVQVVQEGENLLINQVHGQIHGPEPRREAGGFLNAVLSFLEDEDQVTLRLPEGWGVEFHVISGDVEVRDIPFVKGHSTSGDIELEGVRGVDLEMASGDLEAELTLDQGRHRIRIANGDAEIKLVNSSVQVGGVVMHGDFDARGNFWQSGQKIKGSVGKGQGELEIHIVHGDLTLEDKHGRTCAN